MTDTAHPNFLSRAAHCAALLFLCAGLFTLLGQPAVARMVQEKLVLELAQGPREITVEVAETPQDMAMGLMFRTSLAEDHGMLFPAPAPHEANMWMRNTYIPLDMVFIRADGVIHRIEPMTEPLSETIVASKGLVLAVLELAGGASARMGLKAGDRVRHRIFKSAP